MAELGGSSGVVEGEGRISLSENTWEERVFGRPLSDSRRAEDEATLKWIALQKLPSMDRMRTALVRGDGGEKDFEAVDVAKLGIAYKQRIMEQVALDNERFLRKLRDRIDKVEIDLPKIEVRFQDLHVDADVYVGGRALPTLYNYTINTIEELFGSLRLSPTKKRVLTILDNVTGIIKPCRLTLLLGPPGSGKTTFLKALCGKLDHDLRVSGNVTYNGCEFNEFVPHRTSGYISQTDLHTPELTVRETLDFSCRCQGVGSRYDMLAELCRREKAAGIKPDPDIDAFMKALALEGQERNIRTDYVLKVLGLDICADTLVGDQMRRGISGGQKKRLTTGEVLVGPAKALFMDEISTGLDSSTTYQIVKHLRQTVHNADYTIIVSLLQPAPEVYNLFDDLILLAEGSIIYQGPCNMILDFFYSLGFKCPERKGVADFLQEVISRKDQEQYWMDSSREYRYVSVEDFALAFSRHHIGQDLARELKVPYDKSKSNPAALVTKQYGSTSWNIFQACVAKEVLLMKRNAFIYAFKTTQILVMATVSMTVFLRTQHHISVTDGTILVSSLFYSIVVIMFNGFAELAMTINRLPIFYKQRNLLYPSWAFSVPAWIMRMPFSLLETAIWVLLTYWVIGYAPEVGRFFRQFLLLFTLHNMAMSGFRFMASLGRTMLVANTFGSFSLVLVFILGGFVISRSKLKTNLFFLWTLKFGIDAIHPWWIWAYWSSPLMYAQNAIAVNEFTAPRWRVLAPNSTESVGTIVLKARGIFPDPSWFWIGIGALVGFAIFFNIFFTIALTVLKPFGKPSVILSEEILNEKHKTKTGQDVNSSSQEESFPSSRKSFGFPSNGDPESGDVKTGMVLPFQPLSIAFHKVSYFVDMPKEMKAQGETLDRLQLLKEVSGAFRPGVLTALVGVSGAGKTTLMDVLAGRKTGGYIEGEISINGYPKKQDTFARISGYCEQTDIHSPNVTVEESLIYSSWLRLPKEVDKQTRLMFVKEVMSLVELTPLRNALVGLPGVSGLSVEQRKRLTIAVELVSNPSIIFMDEPTSGLDARAAAIVMRTVRNTVDTGRTVVCTIHQPSIDIFESFDELLLMKGGGQVIYAGPLGRHSHHLIEFFQAVEGVPPIEDGSNPATWMLDVTAEEVEVRLGIDFAKYYEQSSLYKQNDALVERLSKPMPDSSDLHFPTKYSQSFYIQCKACFWKQYRSYWKNPHYNVVRYFFTTICALLFGTIFWREGKNIRTEQELFNVMGSMYAACLFLGVNNCTAAQPVVGVERTVFYRERAAGMYSAIPYALAQVAIELPYVFIQTAIYLIIVYSTIAYEWSPDKFFWFFFFMYSTFLYFTFYGMMVVSLTPNYQLAAVVSSAFFGFWNLFSGFLIPRPKIPIWWRWYYYANPVAWTLNGLITSQLGDRGEVMDVPGKGQQIVRDYIKHRFGFHKDRLGEVAAVHILFVLVLALTFAFSIKYFNFQKR
ncbi:pleiotropic drug resistance protein 1 [Selaginella moellendorffii]|uniref:pleiotropic drug resistance protein 1 n=1 Tax=Selaginella moellendorffii TaxID=88036 RepID=UPI000D1C5203|nr:pleiotropic drug resistance protein 1 [Selaginella moellendorffii]|eukprot:XP_024515265.1 pleiotropic drug resistance protein 1 [Selaginella moellendorffii]